jgi:2,3-bisphosphoglycerate-dependent phosphoglycerate mutase
LTPAGQARAERLADFLVPAGIGRIVSSPYRRALDSIAPLAARLGLTVTTDKRLRERVLSADPLPDWRESLRATFTDPDLRYPGGESSRAATARGMAAIHDALAGPPAVVAVITHGNLATLLLHDYDPHYGFVEWSAMTNPDVYRVTITTGGARVERLWRDE